MKTPDQLRAEAAAAVLHVGRSWPPRHDLEDACPCPQAACGLVNLDTAAPDCPEHGYLHPPRSMRQGHPAERCPAANAEPLEPHHRAGRQRTDSEDLAVRQREALARLRPRLDDDTIRRAQRTVEHLLETE